MTIRKTAGRAWLMGCAAAALSAGLAHAQAAPAETETQQPQRAQTVVVTGTLLANQAELAQQPLQIVTAEQFAVRGFTSAADALSSIPALQFSNTIEQTVRDSAVAGRATLDLRGMGTARTLVLVNGRRHVAGQPGTAAVDVASIPSGLIERVDVLTGGASAIYGSDAVTGVVNFVLKEDYQGQELTFQYDISGEGDGGRGFASYLGGRNFADGKGNVTVALQWESREGLRLADREWTANNGIPDDYANPALRFQEGDPLPAGVTAQQAIGRTIFSTGTTPRFANTSQALIDRARAAPPLFIGKNQNFAISATQGLIGFDPYSNFFAAGPGEFASAVLDVDRNGVDDCRQSAVGRGLAGFTAGCWVLDNATGALRPFRDGVIADGINQFGGDGARQDTEQDSLIPDTNSVMAHITAEYEFSPNFRLYTELKAVQNKGREYSGYNTYDDTIIIRMDNPYIPTDVRALAEQEIQAQLRANPNYNRNDFVLTLARDHTDLFNPLIANTRRTYRGVVGVDGQFWDNFTYDLSVNYGRTEETVVNSLRLRDRFFAAIDVTTDARGNPVCRITQNGTIPIASFLDPQAFRPVAPVTYQPSQCRPVNLFGLNKASPEGLDFINYRATDNATIEQTVVRGLITGDSSKLFELPGGPIGVALGAEYREEKSEFRPDVNRTNRLGWEQRTVAAVIGQFDVTEFFGEISLPVLADVPFAELLNFNLAYRAGDYSTVGQTDTWKVDGVWAPFEDIRFRAGVAETVRAPNITELFLAPQNVNSNPRDVCLQSFIGLGPNPANRLRNCSTQFGRDLAAQPHNNRRTSQFSGTRLGNPNLQAETSESQTFGVVFTPRFLEGLTLTVDYWDISIENAISTVTQDDIVATCYDSASLDNQYCRLFTRNLTGAAGTNPQFGWINSIRVQDINFAGLEASGIDFDVSYVLPLERIGVGDLGDLTARLFGTYLEERRNFPFPAEPNRPDPEKGELDRPEWSGTLSLTWDYNAWSVALFNTYQSEQALRGVEIERLGEFTPNLAPEIWWHDLSIGYRPSDSIGFLFGINNITDEKPFFTETSGPVSALGRSFFARVTANF